jgi:hypothetical protein
MTEGSEPQNAPVHSDAETAPAPLHSGSANAVDNAPFIAWLAAAAAWIVPGLGHLLLRRWGRAAAIFVAVGGMAIAGYKLQGQVFSLRTSDVYSILGHWAEIGAGVFYFLWRFLEPAGANLARATGDIGTRLLAIAGLLNFLCMADAFEIARRARN